MIQKKNTSYPIYIQDFLVLMAMLVPIFFGYQLALHLFFVGWLSICSLFSKKSLGGLFLGVVGLIPASIFQHPFRILCFLGTCFLFLGLIEPLCFGLSVWMIGPIGYFFLNIALDSSVKMLSLFLTLTVVALTPSLYRAFALQEERSCFFENFLSPFKRAWKQIPARGLSFLHPMDFWLILIACVTLVWLLCVGLPVKTLFPAFPLRYKNAVLLFNFLALPFLWRRSGWGYLIAMIAVNYFLGVRTGMMALVVAGGAWIVAGRWPKFFVTVMSLALLCGGWWAVYGLDMFIDGSWIATLGGRDRSFYERILVWKKVAHIMREYPWFGRGPCSLFYDLKTPLTYVHQGESYTVTIVHPHNIFLEIRACFGIVGLAVFIGAVIAGMRRAYKKWSINPSFFALSMSGLSYLFVLWSGYLSFFKDPWIVAWAGIVWTWASVCFLPLMQPMALEADEK